MLAGVAALAAAATVTACAGKALDVGTDGPLAGGGSTSAAAGTGTGGTGVDETGGPHGPVPYDGPRIEGAEWPDPADCKSAPNSPLVGRYKGRWPLGSVGEPSGDAVLTIRGLTADGQPCGTLYIGEGDPPAPATDPDAPYPASTGAGGGLGGSITPGVGRPTAQPGVEYQILDVESSSSRLAFSIAYNELLRSWCGLQTRYPESDSCMPGNYTAAQNPSGCTITPEKGMEMSIPCVKLSYSNANVCRCTEEGCDAVAQPVGFELHWDGPNLEGAVYFNTPIFLDRVP